MGLLTLDGVNVYGYTKEQWDALSRRERNKLKWKSFVGNVLPGLVGGSAGIALFAKDPALRKIGTAITTIGITGGLVGIDPTDFKGSYALIKKNGLNFLNLGKKGNLSTDQKAGFGFLADPNSIETDLSFVGTNQAKVTLKGQDENYLLNYDSFENLTSQILTAKGIKDAGATQIVEAVGKQKNSAIVKDFLSKLWKGVWNSAPEILAYMKTSGLKTEESSDGWDGTSGQVDDAIDPDKKVETPSAEKGLLFGFKTENVLLTVGGAGLAYAVFKQ